MVNAKKLGLVALVLLGIAKLVNGASDGDIEIRNTTSSSGSIIEQQAVNMFDNYNDVWYMPPQEEQALISYIYDPNSSEGPMLNSKGINSQNTNEVKIWFESRNVPTDIDHFLKIRIFSMGGQPADMNDYATRNLTLYQEPNNLDADPNLYDIKDLTNWGTKYGYINLPNISCDPNLNRSQWIFRSDNYADITGGENGLPDGRVDYRDVAKLSSYWANTSCDPNNHWCDFADLDRDGDVDFRDFSRMSLEWLYDTNDPNTW
jgi:hypothetical protein